MPGGIFRSFVVYVTFKSWYSEKKLPEIVWVTIDEAQNDWHNKNVIFEFVGHDNIKNRNKLSLSLKRIAYRHAKGHNISPSE